MSTLEIASILEDAPAWALAALGAPDERVRRGARLEVAEHLLHRLGAACDAADADQLALPLA